MITKVNASRLRALDNFFFSFAFRWPLLIDTSPQSSTFLRYRDTNFINALNPKHVEPEVIRLALLGGLR